jgi:hypothetical protein
MTLRVTKLLVAGSLLAGSVASGAAFAEGTLQQQMACRPDVFRLCSSYIPRVGAIVSCLRGSEARLSEACHQVMFPDDHSDGDGGFERTARLR